MNESNKPTRCEAFADAVVNCVVGLALAVWWVHLWWAARAAKARDSKAEVGRDED